MNRSGVTNGCTPIFLPPSLGFPSRLALTSCPSASSSPSASLLYLPHHCPSSATYLILFTDSLQPLTPPFLKEKELKLAGEMNNVTAINGGMQGSVFSCVCGGEGTTRRGGGSGVDSGPALYAPFQLLHRLQKRRNYFCMEISLHGLRRLA